MISQDQVKNIFNECLLRKEEIFRGRPKCPHLKVDPISKAFEKYRISFNKDRLSGHAETINTMIEELPEVFHGGKGAFLSAAMKDRGGEKWTEKIIYAEELLLLGMAMDRIEFKLARGPKDTFFESAILSVKKNGIVK